MKRKALIIICILLVIITGTCTFLYYSNHELIQSAPIGSGYVAQVLASGLFVSNRSYGTIISQDLIGPSLEAFQISVDHTNKTVTASIYGFAKKKAVYREGLGCTLLNGGITEQALRDQPVSIPPIEPVNPLELFWPTGDRMDAPSGENNVDVNAVSETLDWAFSEPDSTSPRWTRAVVVVYDGHLIAERYAPDIHKDMPLLGWSMTKSVMNALVGILIKEGKLVLDERASVPEWSDTNDPRNKIKLNHLMQMSSGLAFQERYDSPLSEVNEMLWNHPNTGVFAALKSLSNDPGTYWKYSSGTTNIVARIIKQSIGGQAEYFAFPRKALFNPLGMRTAVIEPDASGTFICSSLMFASARDWARLGLLYLNDGIWEGERILPRGWVKYSTTPAPHVSKGNYGSQIWLNKGEQDNPMNCEFPKLPNDLFWFSGFQDQSVVIIPSRKVVIVRMGMTHGDNWNLQEFILGILKGLPETRKQV